MFRYRRLTWAFLLLFSISCKHHAKDLVKFVNDQNDGWNSFSITLRDDSTYKWEDFGSDKTGKYRISGNIISMGNEKIVFAQTSKGCIYNASYISKGDSTDMRVVFDSVFCDHIPAGNLIGNWEFADGAFPADTLQLSKNGPAKFKGDVYEKWHFYYSTLSLMANDISQQWLVLDLQQDTILLAPCFMRPIDTTYSIKGIHSK